MCVSHLRIRRIVSLKKWPYASLLKEEAKVHVKEGVRSIKEKSRESFPIRVIEFYVPVWFKSAFQCEGCGQAWSRSYRFRPGREHQWLRPSSKSHQPIQKSGCPTFSRNYNCYTAQNSWKDSTQLKELRMRFQPKSKYYAPPISRSYTRPNSRS